MLAIAAHGICFGRGRPKGARPGILSLRLSVRQLIPPSWRSGQLRPAQKRQKPICGSRTTRIRWRSVEKSRLVDLEAPMYPKVPKTYFGDF